MENKKICTDSGQKKWNFILWVSHNYGGEKHLRELRNETLKINITKSQKELIERYCGENDITISEFVRTCCWSKIRKDSVNEWETCVQPSNSCRTPKIGFYAFADNPEPQQSEIRCLCFWRHRKFKQPMGKHNESNTKEIRKCQYRIS